jgi:TetR/AcrR family transcriptional repressor of nem operon
MGNPKKYIRSELLDRAVELFRQKGFNGASTADLVTELGVNRKSMYAEFGSKQGLFEATLAHYAENHLTRVLSPIEAPDAGLNAIRRAFDGYASASESRFSGLGCLLCNTAVDRGALDEGAGRHVDAYLDRLNRAFHQALGNAQASGEIGPRVDLNEAAAFLTTSLIGVAACVRAKAKPEQLWATSRQIAQYLDGLSQ